MRHAFDDMDEKIIIAPSHEFPRASSSQSRAPRPSERPGYNRVIRDSSEAADPIDELSRFRLSQKEQNATRRRREVVLLISEHVPGALTRGYRNGVEPYSATKNFSFRIEISHSA